MSAQSGPCGRRWIPFRSPHVVRVPAVAAHLVQALLPEALSIGFVPTELPTFAPLISETLPVVPGLAAIAAPFAALTFTASLGCSLVIDPFLCREGNLVLLGHLRAVAPSVAMLMASIASPIDSTVVLPDCQDVLCNLIKLVYVGGNPT